MPKKQFPVISNKTIKRSSDTPETDRKPKPIDRLREALRSRYYSRRTEQAYCHWVKRFIFFHKVRHPRNVQFGNKIEILDIK
ncbi:MAG: phage integrase N-terminal SAM-like domain-containing protein [Candidatus Loosdrechtia sp.]|uniref:phage integrase N-terminal SAM-like domain-containing protein n=1 Tax=Candidatus Loosdrechtia sp. TaxID=3101272 RepID=UPI00403A90FE